MALNDDQFSGKWKQFKGELKKKWGNFTDDDLLYIEGSRDKMEGKIQERYGDRRDEVKKWIDDWFEQNKTKNVKP
ncbi:MAG TPA: CsbD family protein [Nitrospiraceae bacterium]|nr:CsbD family protein [Nitrospiraceae bacterium]